MESKLFSNLSSKEKELFLNFCQKEQIQKKQIIKKEGENPKKAFFLLKGEVIIKKNSSQGEIEVATIKGGEDVLFSFTCMIDGKASLTTVQAKSECTLLSFDKRSFFTFCNQNPKTGIKILQNALELMATFLRNSDEKIAQMYQTLEEVL